MAKTVRISAKRATSRAVITKHPKEATGAKRATVALSLENMTDHAELLRTHISALRAHARALNANTAAMVGAKSDPHAIVYRAMGVPPGANRMTTDAIKIAETPYAENPIALTSQINQQIDEAGLPATKHVGLPAVSKCETIGAVVTAVATAIHFH